MDLSRRLQSTALVLILITLVHSTESFFFHGKRHKRQYGAKLFHPESYVLPGGEGQDQSEWSSWSSPSECSRSCGGGVAFQSRECLKYSTNGVPLCKGGGRKYFSCNTQDCPDDEADFRSQQCSRFNHVPFDGHYYEWIPYTKAPNPCELNCMPRGERFYYRHKSKVIDGTRCNDESLDICVDGQCQSVGCDYLLGSTRREDKCRRCAGDGQNCKTIAGVIDNRNFQHGYNDVLLIPAEATNIIVKEIAPSNNYLACRNVSGHYYLNGNWRIDFSQPRIIAGVWWNYERKPQGLAAPDVLTSLGPLREAIYIVLLTQDKNVGVQYEYSIPDDLVKDPKEPDTYSWSVTAFGPCSASCGGGFQVRNITCNSHSTMEQVDDSLCDATAKPADTQRCQQEECAPKWFESEWEKCSKPCGSEGKQTRKVYCERISENGVATEVEDSICLELAGNKPATEQECNREAVCPKWHLGPWTPCDKLCGEGVQKRKVLCYTEQNGRKRVLPDGECLEEKPETEMACIMQPCEGVDWITSSWSGCDSCGLLQETRTAICGSKTGKIYNETFCSTEKPELVRPCKSDGCKYMWFTSEWSKCSAKCGSGLQNRIVVCGIFDGNAVKPAEDNTKCSAELKPNSTQECEADTKECPGEWFTGPWEECSKKCGSGERSREVICLANGTKADNCNPDKFESTSEKCNTHPCTEDELIPVDSTSKPIETDDDEECEDEEDIDIVDVDDETKPSKKTDDGKPVPKTVPKKKPKQKVLKDLESKDEDEAKDFTSDDSLLMLSDQPATGVTVDMSLSTDVTEGSGDEGSGDDLTSFSSSAMTDSSVSMSSIYSSTDSSMSTDSSSVSSSDDLPIVSTSTGILSTATSDGYSSVPPSSSMSTDMSDSSDSSSAVSIDSTSEGPTSPSGSTGESSSDSTLTSDKMISSTSSSDSTSKSSSVSTLSSGTTEDSSSTTSSDTSTVETTTDSSSSSSSLSTTEESSSVPITTGGTDTTVGSSDTTVSGSTDKLDTTVSGSTKDTTSGGSTIETTSSGSTDNLGTTVSGSTIISESTASGLTEEFSSSGSTVTSVTDSTVSGETMETTASGPTEETASTFSGPTQTTVSGSDETTVSGSDETTVSGPEETTVSGLDETTVSGSVETTVSGTDETTVSGSSETTVSGSEETTISGSTEPTESTVSGETESTTIDVWGSSSTSDQIFTQYTSTKRSRCKPKKKVACEGTKFGCCPDNTTIAQGPFDKGCPIAETCKDTKFGCCPDGISPAKGKKNKGCPESKCADTLFGCCPDKYTPAEGEDNEGCPEPTTTTLGGCAASEFGCCPDGILEATGPDGEGCELSTTTEPVTGISSDSTESTVSGPTEESPDISSTEACKDDSCKAAEECFNTVFGCCPDNRTAAVGPEQAGCAPCLTSTFGCCDDGYTPAHGPNREGCCLIDEFGCCPDNTSPARGPNHEGCECDTLPYGCCPDKRTPAKGPNNEGCGCEHSPFGCCPDKITPAQGESFEGCPCHSFQFGCCPDGITVPQGPHNYGCHCYQTEFKCCPDEKTPAKGPNFEGCTCAESKYGCCPDGVTEAKGEKFEGCDNVKDPIQKSCSLNKDPGPCSNYTIHFYFDTSYGACGRFWYGGCEGNENRFETLEECNKDCVEYKGREACLLPRSPGPCSGYHKKYYYDSESGTCNEFAYGGCFGNTNRFETLGECQAACAVDESLSPCEQPMDNGPCNGNYERWYYDNETDACLPFTYGGCKGNKNNYVTEHSCNYHCKKPGVHRESCALPKEAGNCNDRLARWYYSESEQKCMPFYYTGCGGNENSYISLEQCEQRCPKRVAKDICEIPPEIGKCDNYEARWYYDTREQRCRQFYYGGCDGNENNFGTEEACMERCEKTKEEPTTTPAPRSPEEPHDSQVCFEEYDTGNCRDYQIKWYYNSRAGICEEFPYSGCGGNGNRFDTEEKCENHCGIVQSTCELLPFYGRCNETYTRWYYDGRSQRCQEFKFSGCSGNRNNFVTEDECSDYCAPKSDRPPEREDDMCLKPKDAGNCDNLILSWFYNDEKQRCQFFYYTGCGGNRNRFGSEEQCERQCGRYKDVDVCQEPVSVGTCDQRFGRYYYDSSSKTCKPFTYSGCSGNGNKFTSIDECVDTCIRRDETPSTYDPATCLLPVQTGECGPNEEISSSRRWYYDDSIGTCIPFIYSGCEGNENNFKSFESCLSLCGRLSQPIETRTDPPNPCEQYDDECRRLSCPYGILRFNVEEICEYCECAEPCRGVQCLRGKVCVVEQSYDRDSSREEFVGVCRQEVKPGHCPSLSNSSLCDRQCNTDADCGGDHKCCYDGCGFVCVLPVQERTTTYYPSVTHPARRPVGLEKRPRHEVDVSTTMGGVAVLKCFATGYPEPQITWKRGAIVLDTNQGRYVLTSRGDLTIVQVHRSDSGTYVCIADNKLGPPVSREIKLDVSDPSPKDAYIIGPRNATQIVAFRQPAVLRCLAGGYPKPIVSWWRGKSRLPLKTDRFEIVRDYSLVLKTVQLSDLGIYTCEAYAGHGKPVSIDITVQARGPVHAFNPEDQKYLQYVIDPFAITTEPPTTPRYPYRPAPSPSYVPTRTPSRFVPAQVSINPDESNTYTPGSEMTLFCAVDGHPMPSITWYKDDVQLEPSSKIQILEHPHKVIIYDIEPSDAGFYACSGRNEYSHSTSRVEITISSTNLLPDCIDNHNFANCTLIVQGRYCLSNSFYAEFCCRSCTLAGQLPPGLSIADINPYFIKSGLPSYKRTRRFARFKEIRKNKYIQN